jgi:hypothetical protein
MDFLSDQLFDGRKIRMLTIVDAYSKVSPAIDVRDRCTGADVVATLTRVCIEHGCPKTIRGGEGGESPSRLLRPRQQRARSRRREIIAVGANILRLATAWVTPRIQARPF